MTEAEEREFWRQYALCLDAQAQLVQKYWLTPSPEPNRIFDPAMVSPKEAKEFWEGLRRNLMSQAAVVKTKKVGGSAAVKVKPRHRRRLPPKLDGKPGER